MTDHKVELNDTVGVKDKIGMKQPLTKEQLVTIEKQFVLILLDFRKSQESAMKMWNRVGFTQLGNAINGVIGSINIYLKEYEEQKVVDEAKKNDKPNSSSV